MQDPATQPNPDQPDQPDQPGRVTLRPEDIPATLPDHPDERKLRQAERELATTLRQATRDACRALESAHPRHRVDAAVALAKLAATADYGRQAMVRAIQDQMDQARQGDPDK